VKDYSKIQELEQCLEENAPIIKSVFITAASVGKCFPFIDEEGFMYFCRYANIQDAITMKPAVLKRIF
jgi:hypothetical protein